MPTVTDVCQQFDVTKQTVRTWAGEFSDYLSPAANPPKGKARYFSEDDMGVFALVATLREQKLGYEDVHRALAAGERMEPPAGPDRRPPEAQGESTQLAPLSLLENFAQRIAHQYQGQIDHLEEQRDYLRGQLASREGQLEAEREARLTAEKEAARLGGRLEALEAAQQKQAQAQPPGATGEGEGRGARRRWPWRWPWAKD